MILLDEYREYHVLAEPELSGDSGAYRVWARHRHGGEAFRVGHVWRTAPRSWRWSDWDDTQRGSRTYTRRDALDQAVRWWYSVWIAQDDAG